MLRHPSFRLNLILSLNGSNDQKMLLVRFSYPARNEAGNFTITVKMVRKGQVRLDDPLIFAFGDKKIVELDIGCMTTLEIVTPQGFFDR